MEGNQYTMKYIVLGICAFVWGELTIMADDFYEIHDIKYYHNAPADGPAVYNDVPSVDDKGNKTTKQVFNPCIEVRINVKESIKSSSVFAHAYFFDGNKSLIATVAAPAIVDRGDNHRYDWPDILPKGDNQSIFFAVPDAALQQTDWSVLVVFGDSLGVDARLCPGTDELDAYDYPEKSALEDKDGPPIKREIARDPIIEHIVQTDNPNQPQITMFMRPPIGLDTPSQAKGVLCMSLLADSVDEVKKQLQEAGGDKDVDGILKFAEDHQLVIICWGSRGLWDAHKNWDDLKSDTAWDANKSFDEVANAWESGVQYFVKEYGIPSDGYLMWGMSGSGQYACRLALRKPGYFLAVHVHIPSSFDKPTPEARRILWCLTTGELEPGYQRSLRFYNQCEALGYPMVYKAIVGLGHAGSPIADDIGLKFFDYALSVRNQRTAFDSNVDNPLVQNQMSQGDGQVQPWLESFGKPAYYGDAVNQGIYTYAQKEMVPAAFRVSLPTKEIADAWNQ
jgi:hypothetical protein